MKKSRFKLSYYLLGASILTLVSVALRTVALITEYNFATGYFGEKTLITIADWLTIAVAVGSFSYLLTANASKKFVATYDDATTYIPSALVAVATLCLSAELVGRLATSPEGTSLTVVISRLIAFALGLLTVAALFVSCFRTLRRDVTRAAYQICAVLFLGVYAAYIYFDNPLPINTPCRVVDIMAYLSSAVFFLYEVRISLGRDKWNLYAVFGLISTSLCAYSSIPSIITFFVKGASVSHSIQESVLTLALAIFAALRLIRSTSLFEDAEAAVVSAIKQAEEKARAARAAQLEELANETLAEDGEAELDENDNYTIELTDGSTESSDEERDGEE